MFYLWSPVIIIFSPLEIMVFCKILCDRFACLTGRHFFFLGWFAGSLGDLLALSGWSVNEVPCWKRHGIGTARLEECAQWRCLHGLHLLLDCFHMDSIWGSGAKVWRVKLETSVQPQPFPHGVFCSHSPQRPQVLLPDALFLLGMLLPSFLYLV